jgi:transposase
MENQHPSYDQNTAQLEARISALETALLEKDTVLLEKEAVITENVSIIQKLEQDVEYMTFQLDQLRRMMFGAKKERFIPEEHPSQLQIPFETKAISEVVKEEQEKIRLEYERKKVKKEHPGRMPLPSHLPVNEIIIEPSEDITNMTCIGQEVTEELDYTPAKLHINRYIRKKYITKEDEKANQKQVIAPLNRPLHKCIASANLLGMIFINKYVYHLPVYRTSQMLTQLGVVIPDSTLESWISLGANLLRPLYAIHRLHVFREIYQMIDESPIKVQDPGKKGTCHQGYMWVRYAPLSKSVLFEYYKSRSANGPIDDLNTFSGYIQTDGYGGYTILAEKEGLTHLSCWAHARRYIEAALKNDKERASHLLKLIQILYTIEALARDKNMTHNERHALRLEKSLPVINEIGAYIHKHKGAVTPKSPIGRAFEYCSNRWTSLQNYLTNGMLEIDSNLVENSIRVLALGRKNYLFAGSHDAAQNIAMFYSFFGTCKKLDIDAQKWLKYVMENIHTTPAGNFKELLPQYIDKNLLQ